MILFPWREDACTVVLLRYLDDGNMKSMTYLLLLTNGKRSNPGSKFDTFASGDYYFIHSTVLKQEPQQPSGTCLFAQGETDVNRYPKTNPVKVSPASSDNDP